MDVYSATIKYWTECINAENAHDQGFGVNSSKFSLTARTRALLFEGDKDSFILNSKSVSYEVSNKKTKQFLDRASINNEDTYFGYPLLLYYDDYKKRNQVVPLLLIKIESEFDEGKQIIKRSEAYPSISNKAMEALGLRNEEIVLINNSLLELFKRPAETTFDDVINLIRTETEVTTNEDIDPTKLSTSEQIDHSNRNSLYNKAMLFASESSSFNMHLLSDLTKLSELNDLNETSLKYLEGSNESNYKSFTPVLPFQTDSYQLKAMEHILGSPLTVVTGPPGTGKSQFISNLILNLFLQNKKVLFVSHTGEAVRVVDERINTNFPNLMMRTGKKELRQDLGQKLSKLVEKYNGRNSNSTITWNLLEAKWSKILSLNDYVVDTDNLTSELSELFMNRQSISKSGIINRIKRYFFTKMILKLKKQIALRDETVDILKTIEEKMTDYVEASGIYVDESYLSNIFESGNYGDILAFIEDTQSRSFRDMDKRDYSKERLLASALESMNVWSCTLKSLAATFPLKKNLFDYVIFDEASQIDLPSAAPALYRSKNVVIVGDQMQLNHITKLNADTEKEIANSTKLSEAPIYPQLCRYTDVSLFTSAKRSLTEPEQRLFNHYRSNRDIANMFNEIFYSGKLNILEPEDRLPSNLSAGVKWVDIKGESTKHQAGSRYNKKEIAAISKVLTKIIPVARANKLTIGVVTPYSMQCKMIADKVFKIESYESKKDSVKVLTVHRFQGSEVDILIFSPVIAGAGDGNSDNWFVANEEILNVAVSRARHLLIIMGDKSHALKSKSKLRKIATYCSEEKPEKTRDNKPMNKFEKSLHSLLKQVVPKEFTIEPQYVVGGKITVDFALISDKTNIALELDGSQHEVIVGLVVADDLRRDKYLNSKGWTVHRIPLLNLLYEKSDVEESIAELFR